LGLCGGAGLCVAFGTLFIGVDLAGIVLLSPPVVFFPLPVVLLQLRKCTSNLSGKKVLVQFGQGTKAFVL
jgi:hypothetical protein